MRYFAQEEFSLTYPQLGVLQTAMLVGYLVGQA